MGYTSQYPPAHSDTYVKSTTTLTTYYPYIATNPLTPLTGAQANNWLSSTLLQRFHIDLGSGKVIKRIYYENFHNSGGDTHRGANNFTLWGSNDAGDFTDLVYGNDGSWTELTVAQNNFDIHISADQADPKYILVTNSTAYRYYAFKIADVHPGGSSLIGLRRIELQISDAPPPPAEDLIVMALGKGARGRRYIVKDGLVISV
ncbi:unnamed protein product [marine sediment metagenome]|uniref:F5/8 type C domain-containing protein n=1 Tax=marine sediment metagenome TaxID=412755 RepID=X1LPP3_9ZZZZ